MPSTAVQRQQSSEQFFFSTEQTVDTYSDVWTCPSSTHQYALPAFRTPHNLLFFQGMVIETAETAAPTNARNKPSHGPLFSSGNIRVNNRWSHFISDHVKVLPITQNSSYTCIVVYLSVPSFLSLFRRVLHARGSNSCAAFDGDKLF